jgi:hypothetical protein
MTGQTSTEAGVVDCYATTLTLIAARNFVSPFA